MRPHPESGLAHVVRTMQVAHIDDIRTGQAYLDGNKAVVDLADIAGARTLLIVPMVNSGKLVGAISIYRQEIRPFTDKQIALVQNFATQAVIAIENTRLLNELRQRTDDLTESLEQQTATSEVLQVISSSPGDLVPVFETLLAKATGLCDAKIGALFLLDGGVFRAGATHVPPSDHLQPGATVVLLDNPNVPLARLHETKQVLHIADLRTDQSYVAGNPRIVSMVDSASARTFLGVPMLKENELIGAINIYRTEVLPFTDKQIELVKNFAAQAVIAIENTRLLNELRQSLEQQTATADVLRVISSSPGELEPVFEAMLQNAVQVCDAKFGNIYRWDGDGLHLLATHNTPRAFAESRRNLPFRPGPHTPTGRMVATKSVTHVADLAAERGYAERDPLYVESVEVGGIRTLLSVPMLKENELIGALTIYRQEVRPFSNKQIKLVENFAAQAVIAIENTRLLNELRQRTSDLTESLEQQTATSEVLSVISSSPGELEPVFQAMLENATRICHAKFGVLQLYEGRAFRIGAIHNAPPAFAEAMPTRTIDASDTATSVHAHGHDEGGCPDRGSDDIQPIKSAIMVSSCWSSLRALVPFWQCRC